WRRRRWQVGTAAATVVAIAATAPFLVSELGKKPTGKDTGRAPAAAGGLPGPLSSLGSSRGPSAGASGGLSPSAKPTPTSGGHGYDTSHDVTCNGLNVTRTGNTMHVTPLVRKSGNPDPGRFMTVIDFFQGQNAADISEHKVYTAGGIGTEVDVPVPGDLNYQRDIATVFIAYYQPGAAIPHDPNQLSVSASDPNRVGFACGNAVVTLQMMGGTSQG
ncbi:MAG TPA: hypothetical protein VF466_02285, partial [Candidatus Saccharimonadales bacterium]